MGVKVTLVFTDAVMAEANTTQEEMLEFWSERDETVVDMLANGVEVTVEVV